MPIYRGSTEVKDIYVGATPIGRVYRGSTLVYEKRTWVWNDTYPNTETTGWSQVTYTPPGQAGTVSLDNGSIAVQPAGGVNDAFCWVNLDGPTLVSGNTYQVILDGSQWFNLSSPTALEINVYTDSSESTTVTPQRIETLSGGYLTFDFTPTVSTPAARFSFVSQGTGALITSNAVFYINTFTIEDIT